MSGDNTPAYVNPELLLQLVKVGKVSQRQDGDVVLHTHDSVYLDNFELPPGCSLVGAQTEVVATDEDDEPVIELRLIFRCEDLNSYTKANEKLFECDEPSVAHTQDAVGEQKKTDSPTTTQKVIDNSWTTKRKDAAIDKMKRALYEVDAFFGRHALHFSDCGQLVRSDMADLRGTVRAALDN